MDSPGGLGIAGVGGLRDAADGALGYRNSRLDGAGSARGLASGIGPDGMDR